MLFVSSVIHEFTTVQRNEDNEFIIPTWLFELNKIIVLAEIPYCFKNESSSKQFIEKFDKFTNDIFDIRIKMINKVKTLFRVKDELYIKPVKFIKVFAHVVKVISVGMNITIQ